MSINSDNVDGLASVLASDAEGGEGLRCVDCEDVWDAVQDGALVVDVGNGDTDCSELVSGDAST